jgi:outer membrane receptor protein involved in Fe transport
VARAATGVRYRGFAGELAVRHLGDRYASEDFYHPRLSGYTVLDLGLRYRWRFLELGLAVENLADTDWRSSEFYYTSRPVPASLGGAPSDDFHFTPGNPRNVRAWLTAYF